MSLKAFAEALADEGAIFVPGKKPVVEFNLFKISESDKPSPRGRHLYQIVKNEEVVASTSVPTSMSYQEVYEHIVDTFSSL